MKGEKSFYKPFLDYLPASNETLFTIDSSQTTISADKNAPTLYSEIQNNSDDIFFWIRENKETNAKSKVRFEEFIIDNFDKIRADLSDLDLQSPN